MLRPMIGWPAVSGRSSQPTKSLQTRQQHDPVDLLWSNDHRTLTALGTDGVQQLNGRGLGGIDGRTPMGWIEYGKAALTMFFTIGRESSSLPWRHPTYRHIIINPSPSSTDHRQSVSPQASTSHHLPSRPVPPSPYTLSSPRPRTSPSSTRVHSPNVFQHAPFSDPMIPCPRKRWHGRNHLYSSHIRFVEVVGECPSDIDGW